jgi:2-isopropylmalate synthase
VSFDPSKYRPYPPVERPQRRWPDRVLTRAPTWCAVDLRDGNQALVKPMSVAQKLRLFRLLLDVGFKEIEVGFPAASQPDYDFVRAIIEQGLVPADVTIQVLTQAREELIARTFESLRGARRAVVHLYNSTSTAQRERVFEQDRAAIRELALRGATALKAHARREPGTEWVLEYSPESFTGTELDYAAEVVNAVVEEWRPWDGQAVIINLPATVEMSTPNVYADRIEWMCDHIHAREHLQVSIHTHNDRGCGVAAAELGLLAGADRIEGTLLGNGERTGNVDLVTLAMNLYSQGIDPKLDLSDMRRIVETVEYCTDIPLHPRHPYAGELVYTAFSGSHQDAIHKSLAKQRADEPWQVAYLPLDPKDLGRSYEEIVRINSQSGKGGLLHVLERDFGITLPRWLQVAFSKLVQHEAEHSGGEVASASIRRLFDAAYLTPPRAFRMTSHQIEARGAGVHVRVTCPAGSFTGDGDDPARALASALRGRGDASVVVESCDEYRLAPFAPAASMACVRLRIGADIRIGVALAADSGAAALQAALTALGRHHELGSNAPAASATTATDTSAGEAYPLR